MFQLQAFYAAIPSLHALFLRLRSARRPSKFAPAKKVQMQVVNRLSAVCARVEHKRKPSCAKPFSAANFCAALIIASI